jgi:hypothetical protein
MSDVSNRRDRQRQGTVWAAECRIGDDVVVGTVYDLTSDGAFFHPEMNLTKAEIYDHRDGANAVKPDDGVLIRLMYRQTPDVRLMGSVRWTGISATHGCGGFGVQLSASPELLKDDIG